MGVGVAVGVSVLVGVRVGIAVAVGVAVGIAVAVGESVGVEDGVLVGAGAKVGIGVLIGDGVPSAPQKQAGANATGSVRNAMRITYGRRIIVLPRLVQGVRVVVYQVHHRTVLVSGDVRQGRDSKAPMSCRHLARAARSRR